MVHCRPSLVSAGIDHARDFGTSLAVVVGGAPLSVWKFLTALSAMMILHAAANMLSDVIDFRQGLDTEITPVSGAVVRGPAHTLPGGRRRDRPLPPRRPPGPGAGAKDRLDASRYRRDRAADRFFYPALKYRAFGDLAVFLNFGILGSLGAWTVQTKTLSWTPVVSDDSHGDAGHRHPPRQQLARCGLR